MLTVAERVVLQGYIKQMESAYCDFMGGVSLPKMKLQLMMLEEMMKVLANAEVIYDPETDSYTFRVFEHINNPLVAKDCEYIIYHEFTHALDISLYGAGGRDKYNQLRGYLEHHASQVELMKMLGADTFAQPVTFSMTDSIRDMNGELTVLEFMEKGLDATAEQMSKPDFKQSIGRVFHAVGTLYNHLGRISICRMYATDFGGYEYWLEKKCAGSRLLGQGAWDAICKVFNGVMGDAVIGLGGKLCYGTLVQLSKRLGLVD